MDEVAEVETRGGRHRRKVVVSAAGALAAIVLAGVVVARSWLLPSVAAEPNSVTIEPQGSAGASASAGTPGSSPPSGVGTASWIESTTTAAAEPPSTAPADPATTSAAVPAARPEVETGLPGTTAAVTSASDSPTQPHPESLDNFTVKWFQTLCAGGLRINEAKPAETVYPNLKTAQQKYADSYAARAAIAQATADSLSRLTQGPVAGGRIDAASAVDGLRDLNSALSEASSTIAQASVTTVADLRTVDDRAVATIEQRYQPVDVRLLSVEEQAFVGQFPGCERLAGG